VTRIALATCAALARLDPDEQLLLEPLRALGVDAQPAVWDDTTVDWAAFDLVVIRSTWDYTERRDAFVAWAKSVPRLANPAEIVEWNTDKHYLRDLEKAGVPVVPTDWLEHSDAIVLPSAGRHVLKPSVGAGSVDAALFDFAVAPQAGLARAHAERLLAGGQTVLVQPYLERIDQYGEAALMFFGGEFSHAVTKGAMLADQGEMVAGLYKAEVINPRVAAAAEIEIARVALAATPVAKKQLAYARVDLVPAADGSPLVMELELTEPSLFLGQASGAAERLARHLVVRVSNPGSG
jgi:glutathione synthase/RimK-type ligase-like ATP-grasp enzyme